MRRFCSKLSRLRLKTKLLLKKQVSFRVVYGGNKNKRASFRVISGKNDFIRASFRVVYPTKRPLLDAKISAKVTPSLSPMSLPHQSIFKLHAKGCDVCRLSWSSGFKKPRPVILNVCFLILIFVHSLHRTLILLSKKNVMFGYIDRVRLKLQINNF